MSKMIFLLLLSAAVVNCKGNDSNDQKTDKPTAATTPKSDTANAASSLKGTIGNAPWSLSRALAYVDPKDSSKIVIGLFDANGPLGCSVEGDRVFHEYKDENSTSTDDVTIWIPSKLGHLPWSSNSVQVSISDYDPSGAGMSDPASSRTVEIKEISATRIVGSVKATASTGNIDGTFVAEFCKK